MSEEWHKKANNAFIRMRRAVLLGGKGVRISAEELAEINLTAVGEILAQYDDEANGIRREER